MALGRCLNNAESRAKKKKTFFNKCFKLTFEALVPRERGDLILLLSALSHFCSVCLAGEETGTMLGFPLGIYYRIHTNTVKLACVQIQGYLSLCSELYE